MSTESSRGRRSWLWGVVILLLAVAAGFGGWGWLKRPKPDMVAVLRVNNQGIGHMEQFKYEPAIRSFEEVVAMAPDWLPGRINLGIALLNHAGKSGAGPLFERAVKLFEEILRQDPKNLYAHHCLGLIFDYQANPEKAIPHFEVVTREDPDDAFAWFYLGKQMLEDDKRAIEYLEQAVKLNPYMGPAIYKLWDKLRFQDPVRAKELIDLNEKLKAAHWSYPPEPKNRYTEMGKYAEVIGRPDPLPAVSTGPLPLFSPYEKLQVQLAGGTRWATREDLRNSPHGELRSRIRDRFGAVMVVLDYDGDGKPDLFLLGAVVEDGKVRDLLLHNDGDGRFTDVTTQAGLGGARPSLGCCVADFDNDGHPDVFITGIGEQHLFHNNGKGGFKDVTADTGKDAGKGKGLDRLNTVCLGAIFVDLDQDGDLDLIVAQYADTPANALAALAGESPVTGSGLALYLNVGEAPPVQPSMDPPPLTPRFRREEGPTALLGQPVHAVGLTACDLDLDFDVDLIVVADRVALTAILNDRLLRFHRTPLPPSLVNAGSWNGALVLDANHDGSSDLLFVGPGQRPVLLLSQRVEVLAEIGKRFIDGATNSPPLLQAVAVDLDHDGWTDVVGLSEEHRPVLLHNDGGRLVHATEALGSDTWWPRDLVGLAVANFTGSKYRDLMLWSEATGLLLYANQGNGNNALKLALTGHRHVEPSGTIVRCNADGFGAWVVAQADTLWTGAEYTTLTAGLGQSRQPLLLGIGKRTHADVLRVRWPDNCWQAELSVPGCQLMPLAEQNRKQDSCPVLFTWDGQRFVFVTDFLGAGTLGESLPGGGYNKPRPEESVKIEAHELKPRDGHFVLKLAEPMNEVTYLDRLQLVVLDHPADVRVYPDERFQDAEPFASQDLLAFRDEVLPVKARDHRGRDVTATLRHRDRDSVSDFARRTWLGLAEEHWVELDFGDRLAKVRPADRVVLCLAGWTDYPYPESIWAADQAGVAVQGPVLERLDAAGHWQALGDAGFPAGLPRMMTLDVTGKVCGPRCVLRLRTNMDVYWDQIFVAPLLQRVPAGGGFKSGTARATYLEVGDAVLSARGCMQEYSPDGRQPTLYDYDRLGPVPVSRLAGRLTRLGDVTELLRDRDDRFVLFGPGDELSVRFDARQLPELPPGWTRSFVLRTWGYCKDCAPFTATGETIEPLPFRAMSGYPYGPQESYPRDALHEDYRRRFNTRQVGPAR